MPPHERITAPKGAAVTRPPHPATVVCGRAAQPAVGPARPPHPATVAQPKPAVAGPAARPPHPATLQPRLRAPAVAALRAPESRIHGAIQLLKIKVQSDGTRITSVSYPSKNRPGGNIRGHQGDHTTAFASFLRMVRNRIMGQKLTDVPRILEELAWNLKGFPGMQIKSADYLHVYITDTLLDSIKAISDTNDIANVLIDIVSLRNQMPLSAVKNSTSSGGHGEGSNIAALQECEDRYRNGTAPRYTPAQMTEWMWDIFDYDPSSSVDTDVVINVVAQHLYSMHMTFPKIFDKIDGYSSMVQYFKDTSQLILSQLSKPTRTTVLKGLQAAATDGPSALPSIGKSTLWDV